MNDDSDIVGLIYNVSTNVPTGKYTSMMALEAGLGFEPGSLESITDMFRLLKKDEHRVITEMGELIIQKLESTMTLTSLTTTEQSAEHFVREVDTIAQSDMDSSEFAWEFGETIIEIASHFTPRSSPQVVLVKALALLQGDEMTGEVWLTHFAHGRWLISDRPTTSGSTWTISACRLERPEIDVRVA